MHFYRMYTGTRRKTSSDPKAIFENYLLCFSSGSIMFQCRFCSIDAGCSNIAKEFEQPQRSLILYLGQEKSKYGKSSGGEKILTVQWPVAKKIVD